MSESTTMIELDGTKEWYLNGQLHREDGPAIEYSDGTKSWYLNGQLHREDGPAIEWSNGTKEWYLNGERHREDGPAIEWSNGDKEWYLNGQLHREDGPALEYSNGEKEWWLNGKLHREDGPAIESASGYKCWYLNGQLHREDGPAVEYLNGDKAWWLNGQRHREDGPAREWANGDKEWYLNGERHDEEPNIYLLYTISVLILLGIPLLFWLFGNLLILGIIIIIMFLIAKFNPDITSNSNSYGFAILLGIALCIADICLEKNGYEYHSNPNDNEVLSSYPVLIRKDKLKCNKIYKVTNVEEKLFKFKTLYGYGLFKTSYNDTIKAKRLSTEVWHECIERKKLRKEKISKSWVKKYIKYDDVYKEYYPYEFNTVTKDIRLTSNNKKIYKYEVLALHNKKKAEWKHEVTRYKGYINSLESVKLYMNDEPAKKKEMRILLNNKVKSICKKHSTVAGKTIYTEYDACVKHMEIGFEKVKTQVVCGYSKSSLYKHRGSISSRPYSCNKNANWDFKK